MIDRRDRELIFIGNSEDAIAAFPLPVKRSMGYALRAAQRGNKDPNAKPLKGFGGAGVLEIVDDHDGDAYRAVYAVKLKNAVYVLHCFQKKSKKGIETPKATIDLVKARYRRAQEIDKELGP